MTEYCPVCGVMCGEIRDANGTSYHCNNPQCTWSGKYEVDKAKDDKK
jgi:hypothetical protein